jgi:hypothetical protein
MTLKQEQETREEAERLAGLSRDQQRQIIALHRSLAADATVPKRERTYARERADALERLLGLDRKNPENP